MQDSAFNGNNNVDSREGAKPRREAENHFMANAINMPLLWSLERARSGRLWLGWSLGILAGWFLLRCRAYGALVRGQSNLSCRGIIGELLDV